MSAGKTVILSINASWNILNFRLGLVRGLQEAGYQVVALAPADAYTQQLADHGIGYLPIAMEPRGTSILADIALFWRYWRTLRRVRPAAFLGYTIKPNIYGSLAAHLVGVPTINNIAGLGETFLDRRPVNRLVRFLYRVALSRARVIFFQNPDDRALFVDNGIVDAARSRLLPGSGIDLSRFTPPSAPRDEAEGISFLLVARLLEAKGIADYAAAARIVRQQYPSACFRLLGILQSGKGALARETIAGWEADGTIEFLGSSDDVRPFLAGSDCVVLPTYYPEGTPRSLLEAAAMGRPLIASDVPGCREIVRDGDNGFQVPPRDPETLAATMLRFIAMSPAERAAMGARSREIAEREYDEQIVVRRYLEALDAG